MSYNGDSVDTGMFEGLVVYATQEDHNGLYIARVGIASPLARKIYMNMMTGKCDVKNDEFLDEYRGKFLKEIPYHALNTQSEKADGAIFFDNEGRLEDDHRVARFVIPEIVSVEARSGTGHISMATLSRFPGVTTYVCSAERKTVKKFRKGKLAKLYDDGKIHVF